MGASLLALAKSIYYFTECKVCGSFFRGRLIMTCNSLFFSCLTDQVFQYLLAPLCCEAFQLPFCWRRFFRLFSVYSGLFFACLGPKCNLSKDDYIFLLNLSCHMAPVCNFPVRVTASFTSLATFFTPEIQKSLNLCLAFVFSFLF